MRSLLLALGLAGASALLPAFAWARDEPAPDRSLEAIARRRQHVRDYQRELERFDARGLDAQDRIPLEMELERTRRSQAFARFYGELPVDGNAGAWEPVSPMHGPQFDLASLAKGTRFRDFDDYWGPFLGGQGPAPGYAMSLSEERREALRERIRERLPISPDGSIDLVARAWAVVGRR